MIICVGSVFVDHIANIDIFPKKPIKVLANNIDKRLGGAAAVAALTVKKFDGKVEFIGRIGDDDASAFIKKELNSNKLKFSKSLILKNTSSSQSYIFEDKKGERLLAAYSSKKLLLAKKIPHFVLSSNHTYLFDTRWIEAALYLSRQSAMDKIKCVGDIDNFKMNKDIKEIVLNTTYPIFSENGLYDFCKIKSPLKALKNLFKRKNKFYAVTLGEKGVMWIENHQVYLCKPLKIKVVETNGAGDVFHGAFAYSVDQNNDISHAIKFATAAATLKCTKKGGTRTLPSLSSVNKLAAKLKIIKVHT